MGTSLVEETTLTNCYDQTRKNFSNNVYLLRHYWGMRRDELAEKVGCSCTSVSRLEGGKFTTTLKGLAKIADILKVTPGRLLDVNSRMYLESERVYLLLNHSKSLEYPPGEFFPERVRAFVERTFLV